jgi:hypothetical protein
MCSNVEKVSTDFAKIKMSKNLNTLFEAVLYPVASQCISAMLTLKSLYVLCTGMDSNNVHNGMAIYLAVSFPAIIKI